MKYFQYLLFTALFSALLYFSSCTSCIEGNGKISSVETESEQFTVLISEIPGTVYIKQDNKFSVEIKTDENLQEFVKANVSKGKIEIETSKCISDFKTLEVYITTKNLSEIILNGSGEIKSSGKLMLEDLEVEINGSGSLKLDFEANDIKTEITGSGTAKYKGETEKHEIDISGSGSLEADKLYCKKADVEIDGSGSAKINVSKKINAKISGSGNLIYKGAAEIGKKKISGSGRIKRDMD